MTKSGLTMDTVAPVSTVNDVGLPSVNLLKNESHSDEPRDGSMVSL